MPKNEKEKKKHVSPKKPEDLWTCSSYLARDLVAQYLRLGVLSQTDAVALYIVSGVLEFGREKKPFYETPKMIARALGLSKDAVKTYLGRLLEDGVITRMETTDNQRKERKWSAPGLTPPSNQPTVSSVVFTTLETEKGDEGHNAYPDGDTPSSPGEETSCSPQGDTPCGLHLRESDKEESEEENQIGKKGEKEPSYLSRDSSFKKRSKTEIQALVDSFPWGDYQLDTPEGLASCWTDLTEIFNPPSRAQAGRDKYSAENPDPMESRRAFMTLKQMRIYKNNGTVRLWLEWYIKAGGLNRSNFLTHFSRSWDDYIPIAARAFIAMLKEEEQAWSEVVDAKYSGAAWVKQIGIDRALGAQNAEQLKKMQESFHKTLPSLDVIRESVEAVPIDADLNNDAEYMRWLKSLAQAVPVLGNFIEIYDIGRHPDFVRLAREGYDGDLECFAEVTREYIVDQAEYYIEKLKSNEYTGLRILPLTWRMYSNYFDLAPGAKEAQGFPQD
ncbi:MAG: winged helix-turn-helix domain-containing protein [Bacteroidia bacterium]|nr:winged helix-turn-helix domain-containing protein [Bacteroidia bacterium]